MKPRILALLIAVPVGAFAVSATMIPAEGKDGNKDKSKQETSAKPDPTPNEQAEASQAEVPVVYQQAENTNAQAVVTPPAGLTTRQLADEMKKGMEDMQNREGRITEEHETWYWELGDEANTLIETKISVPVRKALKMELNENSFSRCPSGIDEMVYTLSDDKTQGEGYVTRYIGCRSVRLTMFRYNTTRQTVSLWVSDDAGFVSVDSWVKAFKLYQQDAESDQNG